jgi:hypothetical protein
LNFLPLPQGQGWLRLILGPCGRAAIAEGRGVPEGWALRDHGLGSFRGRHATLPGRVRHCALVAQWRRWERLASSENSPSLQENQFLLALVFLGFGFLESLARASEWTRMPSLPSRRTW